MFHTHLEEMLWNYTNQPSVYFKIPSYFKVNYLLILILTFPATTLS